MQKKDPVKKPAKFRSVSPNSDLVLSTNLYFPYLEYVVSWLYVCDIDPLAVYVSVVCIIAAWTQTLQNRTGDNIKSEAHADARHSALRKVGITVIKAV